jgi:hypothetical protein
VSSSHLCSELSEAAGEPIAGTASFARSWLVVEVPGNWPRDVSDGAGLPPEGREAVRHWLGRTPAARLLYVRRPRRASADGTLAFVVRADEDDTAVRRIDLASLAALGQIDLDSAGTPTSRPLVLVCGHGARDRCCALRGTAVYGALASAVDVEDVWVSSHQGGHRFAANVLVLPHGIQLGRLAVADAPEAVAEVLGGRVPLARYRGRTAYPPVVQAAERAVREATGLIALDDLRVLDLDGDRVSFQDRAGGRHAARVERGVGPIVPASCGVDPEPQPVLRAHVLRGEHHLRSR